MRKKGILGIAALLFLTALAVLLPPVIFEGQQSLAAGAPVSFTYTPQVRVTLSAAETAALYQTLRICNDVSTGEFVREGSREEDARRADIKALFSEVFKDEPEILSALLPLLSDGTLYAARDSVLMTVQGRSTVLHFIYVGIIDGDDVLSVLYEENARALLSLTYHVALGEVSLPATMELWEAVAEEQLSSPVCKELKERLLSYAKETLEEEEWMILLNTYAYEKPTSEQQHTMLVLEYGLAETEGEYEHARVITEIQEALVGGQDEREAAGEE